MVQRASVTGLFPMVNRAVDGDDCDQPCASCNLAYPRSFKINETDELYGDAKAWQVHVVVATGRDDWKHNVAEEPDSVMQAIGDVKGIKVSASNMITAANNDDDNANGATRVLLLPAMMLISGVTAANTPILLRDFVTHAATTTTPLAVTASASNSTDTEQSPAPELGSPGSPLTAAPLPFGAVALICSHRTRDARCGQSAPLVRRELERHLRPLGLQRDADDERRGGVGIFLVSHVGGHKFAANVIIYRRPDPWHVDALSWAKDDITSAVRASSRRAPAVSDRGSEMLKGGAAQCFWLARVRPQDCESIVKYTILQGKVVNPTRFLKGGFDRCKGLVSW